MMLTRSLALAGLLGAFGCAGSPDDTDTETGTDEGALEAVGADRDDDVAHTAWTTLGTGVSYKSVGDGTSAILVYGGYSAQDIYSQRWAQELFREKREALSLGHIYAIRGPNQSGYANREIQNSRIAAHLAAGRAAAARSIVIVAHSSGTFVSAELLSMMQAGRAGPASETLGKTSIFHLDGGGTGSRQTLSQMAGAFFVYACDSNLGQCSKNTSSMKWLGQTYASFGGAIKLDATGSGCNSGGLWCLHDTLITTKPHNPNIYHLRRDYTHFQDSRKVVTAYRDRLP